MPFLNTEIDQGMAFGFLNAIFFIARILCYFIPLQDKYPPVQGKNLNFTIGEGR